MASPSGKVRVAASTPPLADFVRQVGGEHVEVEVLVPPGASVHTFEPTAAQAEFLSQARLLVLNGVGLEFWAQDLVDAAASPKLVVLDTSQGIEVIAEEAHEKEPGHASGNPHIWLDPANAIIQMEHIRDALMRIDPDHRQDYQENSARFRGELEALDREIATEVATWRAKEFISFHSAYVYFARRYGLKEAAAIEESPGKEPNPQELAEIVKLARKLEARAIFAEPQFSAKAAEVLAAEAGKTVIQLDPLGGVAGRRTYLELMRYNLAQMAKALK